MPLQPGQVIRVRVDHVDKEVKQTLRMLGLGGQGFKIRPCIIFFGVKSKADGRQEFRRLLAENRYHHPPAIAILFIAIVLDKSILIGWKRVLILLPEHFDDTRLLFRNSFEFLHKKAHFAISLSCRRHVCVLSDSLGPSVAPKREKSGVLMMQGHILWHFHIFVKLQKPRRTQGGSRLRVVASAIQRHAFFSGNFLDIPPLFRKTQSIVDSGNHLICSLVH